MGDARVEALKEQLEEAAQKVQDLEQELAVRPTQAQVNGNDGGNLL